MRRLILAVLVASLSTTIPVSVYAETLGVAQKVTITGVMPEVRYVIVDNLGDIISITSNTNNNVTPQVFLNKLDNGNQRPLTPAINKQYTDIMQTVANKMGDIYSHPTTLAPGQLGATPANKSNAQLVSTRSVEPQLGRASLPVSLGTVQPKFQ